MMEVPWENGSLVGIAVWSIQAACHLGLGLVLYAEGHWFAAANIACLVLSLLYIWFHVHYRYRQTDTA